MTHTPAAAAPPSPDANPALARLRALPKAEVHLHLEGCFEPDTLARWARAAGRPLPRPSEALLQFSGLQDFLQFLDWACGLADTADRLAELAYSVSRRLAEDGAGHADAIVNPTHWHAWQGRLPAMIDAFDAGLRDEARQVAGLGRTDPHLRPCGGWCRGMGGRLHRGESQGAAPC